MIPARNSSQSRVHSQSTLYAQVMDYYKLMCARTAADTGVSALSTRRARGRESRFQEWPAASPYRFRVIRQHNGDACGQFLGVVDVQEFVRTVSVGVRTQDSCDEELRARKAPAEHGHERNRSAATGMHCATAIDGLRGAADRLFQPWSKGRCVPSVGGGVGLKLDLGAIGGIVFQYRL